MQYTGGKALLKFTYLLVRFVTKLCGLMMAEGLANRFMDLHGGPFRSLGQVIHSQRHVLRQTNSLSRVRGRYTNTSTSFGWGSNFQDFGQSPFVHYNWG